MAGKLVSFADLESRTMTGEDPNPPVFSATLPLQKVLSRLRRKAMNLHYCRIGKLMVITKKYLKVNQNGMRYCNSSCLDCWGLAGSGRDWDLIFLNVLFLIIFR